LNIKSIDSTYMRTVYAQLYRVLYNYVSIFSALHIHVSADFAEGIRGLDWGFQLLERGLIEVKVMTHLVF